MMSSIVKMLFVVVSSGHETPKASPPVSLAVVSRVLTRDICIPSSF